VSLSILCMVALVLGKTIVDLNKEKQLFTISETAKICSMSVPTIYKLSKLGKLQIVKIGTCSRIRRSEIERMINSSPTLH